MARAGLGIRLRDLSRASGISVTTLNKMESGQKVRSSTIDIVVSTLQKMGVTFVDDGNRIGAVMDKIAIANVEVSDQQRFP